jgi:hypothetical protein
MLTLFPASFRLKQFTNTTNTTKLTAMSILKNNLRTSGSSVQSGARSTNSKIINWVCAALFAGLILFGGNAKAQFVPYNVLVNPGAESGDLTGWNLSLTGYVYADSTNLVMNGVTNGTVSTNQLLAHSGKYTFRTFNTTANQTYMYQDVPAAAGSQWSASVWAICYASNYFSAGAVAHMQVVFYDTNNVFIISTNSETGIGGVYGTEFLDPTPGYYWDIVPPPATDASGWMFLIPTNLNSTDPATESGYDGLPYSPITTILTAPAGTAFVRYQIEFDNSANAGGAVYWDDCVLNKLNQTDPDIVNPQPANVTIFGGQPASFTVNGLAQVRGETLSYQWQKNGINLAVYPGGDIAGASTNALLQFTNCIAADAASYTCVVSDAAGSIRSVPATLTVNILDPIQKVNALGANGGFESAPVMLPWNIFNGCYPIGPTNTYTGTTNLVNIFDGNSCVVIGENGDRDNGLYQVITGVTPGTTWKAGAWAYISSSNTFAGNNTERVQIWFKDSNGVTVPGTSTYESFKIYGSAYTNVDMQYMSVDTSNPATLSNMLYHVFLPNDTWCYLAVTNVVNDGGAGPENDLPWTTLPTGDFKVPTNANVSEINFQIYELCPVASDNLLYSSVPGDAVYWDDAQLIPIVTPTNVTAKAVSGTMNLSFSAGAGLNYAVLYKNNLTDAGWILLTNIAAPNSWATNKSSVGVTYPVIVSDPMTAQRRFYRVQVQ